MAEAQNDAYSMAFIRWNERTSSQAAENHGDFDAWPDIFHDGYIHQFQPESTHKIH